jgi:hypothetical protein
MAAVPPWIIEKLGELTKERLVELSKKYGWPFVVGIAKKMGPAQLKRLNSRQKAIKVARTTRDGRFGPVYLEDKLRYVVFSGEEPIDAFPPVKGDLKKLLRHHNGYGLRTPDELKSSKGKRWVKGKFGGSNADRPAEDPTETPTEAVPEDGATKFAETAERLPDLLEQLTSVDRHPVGEQNGVPAKPGIYLFIEQGVPMYVGQTRNLKRRLRDHSAATSRENQASFAYRLALGGGGIRRTESCRHP